MKYITNCVISDEDWKTQLAKGYPNIPPNEEVKMIQESIINYYGIFCFIEWNGHRYYTDRRNITKKEELKAL